MTHSVLDGVLDGVVADRQPLNGFDLSRYLGVEKRAQGSVQITKAGQTLVHRGSGSEALLFEGSQMVT
jgi:hypothetical protein